MTFKDLLRRAKARTKRILKRGDTFFEKKALRQDSFELLDAACERHEQYNQALEFYSTQINVEVPTIELDFDKSFTSEVNYGITKLELKWALEKAGIPHTYENGKLSLEYNGQASYLLDRQIQNHS